MPIEKVCVTCGKTFYVPPTRDKTAKACSHECAVSVRGKSRSRRADVVCKNCGKVFSVPESHSKTRVYCSKECKYNPDAMDIASEIRTGDKNPMWKGGLTMHSDGYIYKKSLNHPFSWQGYVFQHRLVMEKKLRNKNPDSEYLVKIGNNLFLSPDAVVHHRDFDRANNGKRNLVVMTLSNHSRYHKGCELTKDEYWPSNVKLPPITQTKKV
jgi:hypothetical protein